MRAVKLSKVRMVAAEEEAPCDVSSWDAKLGQAGNFA